MIRRKDNDEMLMTSAETAAVPLDRDYKNQRKKIHTFDARKYRSKKPRQMRGYNGTREVIRES